MAAPKRTGKGHRKEPDPRSRDVGARIKALRLAAGFTFDAFVEETGLGRGYVSELERGMVVPTLTTLERVAEALELTTADLVLGEGPRERLFEVARALPAPEVGRLLRSAEATARRVAVAAGAGGVASLLAAEGPARSRRRSLPTPE